MFLSVACCWCRYNLRLLCVHIMLSYVNVLECPLFFLEIAANWAYHKYKFCNVSLPFGFRG